MPLFETLCATDVFVEPITEAVEVMFDSMFGSGVRRTSISANASSGSLFEITSLVGLAGDISGSFCLSMPTETVLALVKRAVDVEPDAINRLCRDSVNELANVVAGYAKDRLVEHNIRLGLPTAILGRDIAINYPQSSEPIRIEFESDMGRLMVVVGLVHKKRSGE